MSSSLDEVREENGRLRQTLEIKENDLFVAATAGKQLLTRNAELEELIETTHSDYGLEIDVGNVYTTPFCFHLLQSRVSLTRS